MPTATADISAEWEEGMPPALINSAQFHFRCRRYSMGALRPWANSQAISAPTATGDRKNSTIIGLGFLVGKGTAGGLFLGQCFNAQLGCV